MTLKTKLGAAAKKAEKAKTEPKTRTRTPKAAKQVEAGAQAQAVPAPEPSPAQKVLPFASPAPAPRAPAGFTELLPTAAEIQIPPDWWGIQAPPESPTDRPYFTQVQGLRVSRLPELTVEYSLLGARAKTIESRKKEVSEAIGHLLNVSGVEKIGVGDVKVGWVNQERETLDKDQLRHELTNRVFGVIAELVALGLPIQAIDKTVLKDPAKWVTEAFGACTTKKATSFIRVDPPRTRGEGGAGGGE